MSDQELVEVGDDALYVESEPGIAGERLVVLSTASTAACISFSMKPSEARELAAALLKVADMADAASQ